MTEQELLQFDARDLIREITKTGAKNAPALLEEVVARIGRELSSELGLLMDRIEHLKEQRASLHPGQSSEDARRRLQSPKLDTSYPFKRARALLAKRLKLVEEITALVQHMFPPLAKLQLVDAELEATREVLVDIEAVRDRYRATGMWGGSFDFLTRLHNNHRIDCNDFECLTEDDEKEIAKIILRRYVASRPSA